MRKLFCIFIFIGTLIFVPFKIHKNNSIEFKLYNSSLKCIDGQVINVFKIKEHNYKYLIFGNKCKFINSYNPPNILLGIFIVSTITFYIVSKMYRKCGDIIRLNWFAPTL